MFKIYGGGSKMGFTNLECVRIGVLVAVQRGPQGHWHRAKVLFVKSSRTERFIRVFLVDYGDILDDAPFPARVRKLPTNTKNIQNR